MEILIDDNKHKNTILVVDDQPQNIKLIGTLLRNDFNLLVADNGPKAIKSALEKKPDLILLDVMMPEMSGFEACIEMKKIDEIKDIPIIFLTARTETEDIVHAFDIGGVDYITKPFRAQEVIARIKTHLELKNSKDTIAKQNFVLSEKNKQLEQAKSALEKKTDDLQSAYEHLEEQARSLNAAYLQLIEQEEYLEHSNQELMKMNENKDKFFSIISHDLKSPFAGLIGATDLLLHNFDDFTKEEIIELFNSLNENVVNTYKLLEDLLEWARSQMGKNQARFEEIDLYEIAFNVLNGVEHLAENKNITIKNNLVIDTNVICDMNMISTVFRNILTNSVKFTKNGGQIYIASEKIMSEDGNQFIRVSICDTGIGMNESQLDKLFSITNVQSTPGTNNESGTGLGLVISKEFILKHKGRIWADSKLGEGTIFYFELPL